MGADKFKEKYQDVASEQKIKNYGYGIRHLQMFCMTLTMVCLMIVRASMGIAVLAMSEDPHTKIHSNNTLENTTLHGNFYDTIENGTFVKNNGTQHSEFFIPDIVEVGNVAIQTFQWDKKTQSLILSSFFWGYVCMQIPAGILAKKFGGKPILLFALVSNCLISCLIPVLASVGGWMFVCGCRVAMGLTQACLFPATHTLLGQWFPENERTKYVGIVYMGVQVGTIIAMPVCGVLVDTSMGWKVIFYVTAGLLSVNAVIWFCFSASTPREHRMISKEERDYIESGLNVSETRPPTPWRYILRSVPMWVLLAPNFGFVLSFVIFFVDMPTYLEKALHISLKDSAFLSALPYIGMWFGTIFSSFVSDWIYNKKLLSVTVSRKIFQTICSVGLSIGLIILSFLGPENKTLAVVTLVGVLTACGFSSAGFLVNQIDLSPNFAGVIVCILNFITNFGNILMPIATSYILQNDPSNTARWRWVFLFMATISLATHVVYLMFSTSKRQEWDDPDFLTKQRADPEEMKPVLKKEDDTKEKEPKDNQ